MKQLVTQHDISEVRQAAAKSRGDTAPGRQLDELNEQSRHIQELIDKIDMLPDEQSRALMQDCVQSLLELYGGGLERIMQIVADTGPASQEVRDALLQDSLVRGLLLIHDLCPVELETRLRDALEKVLPYIHSHGGNIELVGIDDGIAKLRLQGTCNGCPSSAVTMELAVKQAIEEACPDLAGLEVEGIAPPPSPEKSASSQKHEATGWSVVPGVVQIPNGSMKSTNIGGVPILICKMNSELYAYRNHCPACHLRFDDAELSGGNLVCGLGHRFDVRRAGVSPDDPRLYLEPIPLLVEGSMARIAVKS